jgi:hypothetical protein
MVPGKPYGKGLVVFGKGQEASTCTGSPAARGYVMNMLHR